MRLPVKNAYLVKEKFSFYYCGVTIFW